MADVRNHRIKNPVFDYLQRVFRFSSYDFRHLPKSEYRKVKRARVFVSVCCMTVLGGLFIHVVYQIVYEMKKNLPKILLLTSLLIALWIALVYFNTRIASFPPLPHFQHSKEHLSSENQVNTSMLAVPDKRDITQLTKSPEIQKKRVAIEETSFVGPLQNGLFALSGRIKTETQQLGKCDRVFKEFLI